MTTVTGSPAVLPVNVDAAELGLPEFDVMSFVVPAIVFYKSATTSTNPDNREAESAMSIDEFIDSYGKKGNKTMDLQGTINENDNGTLSVMCFNLGADGGLIHIGFSASLLRDGFANKDGVQILIEKGNKIGRGGSLNIQKRVGPSTDASGKAIFDTLGRPVMGAYYRFVKGRNTSDSLD